MLEACAVLPLPTSQDHHDIFDRDIVGMDIIAFTQDNAIRLLSTATLPHGSDLLGSPFRSPPANHTSSTSVAALERARRDDTAMDMLHVLLKLCDTMTSTFQFSQKHHDEKDRNLGTFVIKRVLVLTRYVGIRNSLWLNLAIMRLFKRFIVQP
jgi:hypothetical protein